MTSDQKLLVKSSTHAEHLTKIFRNLYVDKSMTDCTLCSPEGAVEVHKFLLVSYSSYFDNYFKMYGKASYKPVTVIVDIPLDDLLAITEFMYLGETSISHRRLPSLLDSARKLKVSPLCDILIEEKELQESDSSSNVGKASEPEPSDSDVDEDDNDSDGPSESNEEDEEVEEEEEEADDGTEDEATPRSNSSQLEQLTPCEKDLTCLEISEEFKCAGEVSAEDGSPKEELEKQDENFSSDPIEQRLKRCPERLTILRRVNENVYLACKSSTSDEAKDVRIKISKEDNVILRSEFKEQVKDVKQELKRVFGVETVCKSSSENGEEEEAYRDSGESAIVLSFESSPNSLS